MIQIHYLLSMRVSVSVYVSVRATTVIRIEMLVWWYILTISWSCLSIKVIGSKSLRSQGSFASGGVTTVRLQLVSCRFLTTVTPPPPQNQICTAVGEL